MRLVQYSVDKSGDEPHGLTATFEHDGSQYALECECVRRTTRPSAHTPFPGPQDEGDLYAWVVGDVPDELVHDVETEEEMTEARAVLGLDPCTFDGIRFMDEPYYETNSMDSPFLNVTVE